MAIRGVVFDLDDTLVDTSALKPMRDARRWKDAVRNLSATMVFDGIRGLVVELDRRGIPWAVVTTSVSFYAGAVLKHHALGRHPLVAYHDAPAKPSPAPVLLALQKLGLKPDEVVGVGDAPTDQSAYVAAGVRSAGAAWSPAFVPGQWDVLLDCPEDLLALG